MNDLAEQTEALQNLLISHATGGREDDAEYARLRQMLLANSSLDSLVPQFLRTCRNLAQFWQFIKYKYPTYAERRNYIWGEFNPLLDALERGALAPSDKAVTQTLEKFDAAHVQAAWSKALDRRSSDPEGAITSARTLIESVCKHILDESGVNRGKKTFFGHDKGLDAYKAFEERLRDTLLAMVLDNVIARNADPRACREELLKLIGLFEQTFPNWQDAYSFAGEYFVRESAIAEDRIQNLMR